MKPVRLDSNGNGTSDYLDQAPFITTQPASQSVAVGTNVSFTVGGIGAGLPVNSLALWLKADSGLAQGSTNMPVISWGDQSGRGNNAFQYTEINQPVWVPGAIGNRPAMRFDGTSSYFNLPSGMMNGAAGAEAFVVLKAAANAPVVVQTI